MKVDSTNYHSITERFHLLVHSKIKLDTFRLFEIDSEKYSVFARVKNSVITGDYLLEACSSLHKADWIRLPDDEYNEPAVVCGNLDTGRITVFIREFKNTLCVRAERSHSNLTRFQIATLIESDCIFPYMILKKFPSISDFKLHLV